MIKKIYLKTILILVSLLIFVKGFIGILRYSDDPTVSLVLKFNPFSDNVISYQSLVNPTFQHIVIINDENEIIGEKILLIIFNLNLYVLIIIFLIVLNYFRKKTN